MPKKVKNCVYCGSSAETYKHKFDNKTYVTCSNKDCQFYLGSTYIKEWNALKKKTTEQILKDANPNWPRLLRKADKPTDFIPAQEFAKKYGVHISTVRRWVKTGKVIGEHRRRCYRPLFFENGVESNLGVDLMNSPQGALCIQCDQTHPTPRK